MNCLKKYAEICASIFGRGLLSEDLSEECDCAWFNSAALSDGLKMQVKEETASYSLRHRYRCCKINFPEHIPTTGAH